MIYFTICWTLLGKGTNQVCLFGLSFITFAKPFLKWNLPWRTGLLYIFLFCFNVFDHLTFDHHKKMSIISGLCSVIAVMLIAIVMLIIVIVIRRILRRLCTCQRLCCVVQRERESCGRIVSAVLQTTKDSSNCTFSTFAVVTVLTLTVWRSNNGW